MIIEINDFKKAEQFVQIFQFLKLFNTNISLKLNNEFMFIQGMDSSHVSVYEIKLTNNWFDKYEIDESTNIGINVSIFFKILNIRADSQQISLNVNQDNLDIELTGNDKNIYDKFFTMPLIDIDEEELGIPETDYSLIFSMESKKFKHLIDQFSNFGDDIEFCYKDDQLQVISDNNTEGSMKINIKLDDMESCEVEEDLEFTCSYSLKQISNMAQFFKLTGDLYLNISNDRPFKLLYKLDEENYLRFFLAPKVLNS
jgi:proliferating cell nuclear antigen